MPRKLLKHLCADTPEALVDTQAPSVCCGNSAWIGCDAYSKHLQVQRLERVRQGGSDVMITACPKCQIHLRCAMEDTLRGDELKMEMMDLTSAIARSIYWE